MSTTRSGKNTPSPGGTTMEGSGTATTTEEKRKAAAARWLKDKEDACKAKEQEDESELQEAMAAAALKEAVDRDENKEETQDVLAKETGKDPEESPEKKKSRQTVVTPVRSLLKTGRYARPSMPGPTRMHLHKHKRAIIEAGLALNSTKRFEHLVSTMASLICYCQLGDEFFTINPIFEGG